ncbi:MAG: VCBS repeat-containing protein, partial [bacterium]
MYRYFLATFLLIVSSIGATAQDNDLERLPYNNPGLVVDLGVGLWAEPLPIDFDNDGDRDLVVLCPDKPYNGLYFFENPGGNAKRPVFKAAVRLDAKTVPHNIRHSIVRGQDRLLGAGREFLNFRKSILGEPKTIATQAITYKNKGNRRADQWQLVDIDADGDSDLIVGVDDWGDYGWDDGYTAAGKWLKGPLHGLVFVHKNTGTDESPTYGEPQPLQAGGKTLDVYGWPSPCFADFDADGDLDLICGEFTDGFTYFENVGTKQEMRLSAGKRLTDTLGGRLKMDLCMIVPTVVDWDADGDADLIVGDEDGRVALIEHTGRISGGMPVFDPPYYFQQQADTLKSGALATPAGADWDADGDDDLIVGNTSGKILFFENLGLFDSDQGTNRQPRWAAPVALRASGREIKFEAGENGSIQGPAETKWGYSTLSVADWDHDGRQDLIVNSIWGAVRWFRNVGTPQKDVLEADRPIEVAWPGLPPRPEWAWWPTSGRELATQWRTTPVVTDWTGDGLNDIVMLEADGFLALWERQKRGSELVLLPPRRAFVDTKGQPLKLSGGVRGKSGRRKLAATDWDGDG